MSLIRVYGHPRSGNNLLCAFLARNFYPDMDFTTVGRVGHWQKRLLNRKNKYGGLAGTHLAYHDVKNKVVRPCVYVYRDGRDVAVSLWRTKAFQPPDRRDQTFSEFLHWPLDWCGSPGNPKGCQWPIARHWRWHLESYDVSAASDILKVRYEELLADPKRIRDEIAQWYGVTPASGLKLVRRKVGWFPHRGQVGAWRNVFSDDDLEYFYTLVPRDFWGLWNRE